MWKPFEPVEHRMYRKMGYYSDQFGIQQRYSMEAKNWNEHHENTKNVICKSAQNKGKNKAAILGSGWLLDVPIMELYRNFKEVWLFDIRHSAFVRHKISKLKNIKLIETDLSGFGIPIYKAIKKLNKNKGLIDWELIKPIFDFHLDDFDFVVSCNLLDQLDAIPIEYILKHHRMGKEEEVLLRTIIQKEHFRCLPELKSCMITDVEEIQLDMQGRITEEKKLNFIDIPNLDNSETWIWKFDTRGSYHPHFQTWYRVISFEL